MQGFSAGFKLSRGGINLRKKFSVRELSMVEKCVCVCGGGGGGFRSKILNGGRFLAQFEKQLEINQKLFFSNES